MASKFNKYRVYAGQAEQAICMRLVKEVIKTGKSHNKTEVLDKILTEEFHRLNKKK